MNVVMLVRAVIVVLAFPVFAHLIYSVITLPLRPALTPIFETAGTWAGTLDQAFSVTALALALRGAFVICRRLCPARRFQGLVKGA